jgi:hypothetical protein
MNKESFYKLLLMLGGGFVAFMLFKPKGDAKSKNASASTSKSANGSPKPVTDEDRENAEIVMTAYVMAMEAGENPQNISKLNSETMKEFGLRCYADKQGSLVVCNVNGTEVLKA